MESTAEIKSPKRPSPSPSPPSKRVKINGDVKKVAEMVLVLAAMGEMRRTNSPSSPEKDLMSKARFTLSNICEGFAPKDVFPGDVFRPLIDDLGIGGKVDDMRRPRKVSIAEKFSVSIRKMERGEHFLLPSTPQVSQRLQGNLGAATGSPSAIHPVQMSQSNKSTPMPLSSGRLQSSSPLGHGTASNLSPLPFQLPSSEIRPATSSALLSSRYVSSASPRVDGPGDGRINNSSQASQVQANYSTNSSVRIPTRSILTQSVSSDKIASENTVQAPGGNTHAEIGKIVQKILQPKVSGKRTWIPPSREYMNKPLTCQMCMSFVTEIDSILICDACEKGYHLKCLKTQKGVSKGEWHCPKCLSSNNGKPLPPKYGRVVRNNGTSKASSSSAAVPSASNKKDGVSKENTSMKSVSTGAVGKNYGHHVSQLEREDVERKQENNNISASGQMGDKLSSETCPDDLVKSSSSAFVPAVNQSVDKTHDEKMVELKPNPMEKLDMVRSSSDQSFAMLNPQDDSSKLLHGEASNLKQSLEINVVARDSRESHNDESLNCNSDLPKEKEVVHSNTSEYPTNSGYRSSSDGLRAVDWVGDPVQVLDGKTYYASCCINGLVYKVTDHVLIRSDSDKLIPSKLQAMWEDNNIMKKWVTVNRCYFPGDLPETVGHPCSLESCEVYESICGTTLLAGLIESPCEVLPPKKYAEESENRNQSGTHLNDHLPPLFLCKWIYDEPKRLFRDISF